MTNTLHFIYKITHIDSGRFYIGRTHNPAKRWGCHNKGKGSKIIGRIIKKYGTNRMSYQIIDSAPFPEIKTLEQTYLDLHFNDDLNVNISDSCQGCSKDSLHSQLMVEGIKKAYAKDPEKWANNSRENSRKTRQQTRDWYKDRDNKKFFIEQTTAAQVKRFKTMSEKDRLKCKTTAIENSMKTCASNITLLTWSGVIIDEVESIKAFKRKHHYFPPKGINMSPNQSRHTKITNW